MDFSTMEELKMEQTGDVKSCEGCLAATFCCLYARLEFSCMIVVYQLSFTIFLLIYSINLIGKDSDM